MDTSLFQNNKATTSGSLVVRRPLALVSALSSDSEDTSGVGFRSYNNGDRGIYGEYGMDIDNLAVMVRANGQASPYFITSDIGAVQEHTPSRDLPVAHFDPSEK